MGLVPSEQKPPAVALRVPQARQDGSGFEGLVELPRFRGRGAAFALRDDWVSLFIADRRQIVQAGMPPVRVVPAFDEVEDGHPGLDLGREAPASSSSHSRVAKKLSQRALMLL